MIKFGTDGWRDIIAEGFTFPKVRGVVQGVALYLKEKGMEEKGLVIGYDNRFLSEEFASAAAQVLAGNNIKCYLCQAPAPTPVTAYAVKHLQGAGALMFTASHNPHQYHGIKFIPHYAGPAMPEETEAIGELVNEVLEKNEIRSMDIQKAREEGMVTEIEGGSWYLKHLESLIDTSVIRKNPMLIVVDPMYSAGIGYLETFLTPLGCRVETIHGYRDPLFGGRLPDPAPPYLEELQHRVTAIGAAVGLALDGDADRLGIIDVSGLYWKANSLLPLFLKHLVENRSIRGKVARTVATTHMLDRLCSLYNLDTIETPVGFKHIGNALRQEDVILGGEESGGVSIAGHIPEKDGILAALLFVELLAAYKKDPTAIYKEITDEVGALISRRLDLPVLSGEKDTIMENMALWRPETVGGYTVTRINRADGVKIELENDSWCLIRPSGTEPLFRIYLESPGKEEMERILDDICAIFPFQLPCHV